MHKSKILDILPERIHPFIKGTYYTIFNNKQANIVNLPYSDEFRVTKYLEKESVPEKLPERCVTDVRVFPDRKSMLETFPTSGTVAELGVDKGVFSEILMTVLDPQELYLIDIWDSEQYNEQKMQLVKDKFENHIKKGRVDIVRKRSELALETFEDDFFDVIYIDTTHGYDQTSKELELSRQKIKEDGIISGHDYSVGSVPTRSPYGVIPAVHEFCAKYDWEISHLSLETYGRFSYGLKKIN